MKNRKIVILAMAISLIVLLGAILYKNAEAAKNPAIDIRKYNLHYLQETDLEDMIRAEIEKGNDFIKMEISPTKISQIYDATLTFRNGDTGKKYTMSYNIMMFTGQIYDF